MGSLAFGDSGYKQLWQEWQTLSSNIHREGKWVPGGILLLIILSMDFSNEFIIQAECSQVIITKLTLL